MILRAFLPTSTGCRTVTTDKNDWIQILVPQLHAAIAITGIDDSKTPFHAHIRGRSKQSTIIKSILLISYDSYAFAMGHAHFYAHFGSSSR